MSDSSSDEPVAAAPVKVRPPVVDSDSSEDEVAPASKQKPPSTPVRTAVKNSDRDDSEDKVPKKAAAKEQPTAAKVVAKATADSDDSDDESPARLARKEAPAADQDSSSEEEVAAKPKAKGAAAPAAAAQDSDSSSEEVVSAKPKAKAAAKPAVETDSDDDSPPTRAAPKVAATAEDSDSDSEVASAPKAASSGKPAVVKDSSSDEEMAQARPAPKAPVALANDSDDDDKPAAKAIKAAPETRGDQKKAKLDAAVEEIKSGAGTSSKQKGDDTDELRVIIKGLPFSETEDAVRKVWSSCGKMKHVKMLKREDGSFNGVCFITFRNADGVKAAMKKDGDRTAYKGRNLSVARALKTAPKKGVNPTETKQMKRKVAEPEKNPGGLKAIISKDVYKTMLRLQDQKDFVSLGKLAAKIVKSAEAAQQEIEGQHKAREKKSENTVFVRGLPRKDFDEEAFTKRFQDCGDIKYVWLPLKKDGGIKGFGTIRFKTEEALQKALKYDGTKCKGEVLSVRKSEPVKLANASSGEVKKQEADKAGAKRKTPPTGEVSSEVADKQAKKKHKQAPEAVVAEAPKKDNSERKSKEHKEKHKEKAADVEVVQKKAKKEKAPK